MTPLRSAEMPPESGPGTGPTCPGIHTGRSGSLDESARRLSHEELAVARLYVAEGHDVRSLAESRTGGRRADLSVCGAAVEVKSFLPAAERGGGAPSSFSVCNKLADAAGQAGVAVIYGVGSGLTEQAARRGMARYLADRREGPKLEAARIVGDGFDLSLPCRPERQLRPDLGTRDRRPGLGL